MCDCVERSWGSSVLGLVLKQSDVMPSDADWSCICGITSTIQRGTPALLHIAFVIAYHQLSFLSED